MLRSVALIAVAFAAILSLNISAAAADQINIPMCSSQAQQEISDSGCFLVEGTNADGVTLTNNGSKEIAIDIGAAGIVKTCDACKALGPKGLIGATYYTAKYPKENLYSLVRDCSGSSGVTMGLGANNVILQPKQSCKFIYNDGSYEDNIGSYVVDYYPHVN